MRREFHESVDEKFCMKKSVFEKMLKLKLRTFKNSPAFSCLLSSLLSSGASSVVAILVMATKMI